VVFTLLSATKSDDDDVFLFFFGKQVGIPNKKSATLSVFLGRVPSRWSDDLDAHNFLPIYSV